MFKRRSAPPSPLTVEYDSRLRPIQIETSGGPGIGPDLKGAAYAGPDHRVNYIGAETVLRVEPPKLPPPPILSPLPAPTPHTYVPAMTLHAYDYIPFHTDAGTLQFPSPLAWTDYDRRWNIDDMRVDWRRPESIVPGTLEP